MANNLLVVGYPSKWLGFALSAVRSLFDFRRSLPDPTSAAVPFFPSTPGRPRPSVPALGLPALGPRSGFTRTLPVSVLYPPLTSPRPASDRPRRSSAPPRSLGPSRQKSPDSWAVVDYLSFTDKGVHLLKIACALLPPVTDTFLMECWVRRMRSGVPLSNKCHKDFQRQGKTAGEEEEIGAEVRNSLRNHLVSGGVRGASRFGCPYARVSGRRGRAPQTMPLHAPRAPAPRAPAQRAAPRPRPAPASDPRVAGRGAPNWRG